MKFLEEKGLGVQTPAGKVPIVHGAVIYDLAVGSFKDRPGIEQGYQACKSASSSPVEMGGVGAGTGATAGKFLGLEFATKTGLGCATLRTSKGTVVSALVVSNPYGNVLDPETARIIAGAHKDSQFQPFTESQVDLLLSNTCIGVIGTNAKLNRTDLKKLADLAHDGLARSVFPTHTAYDGDCFFSFSTLESDQKENLVDLGALTTQAVSQAISQSVFHSKTLLNIPCARDVIK